MVGVWCGAQEHTTKDSRRPPSKPANCEFLQCVMLVHRSHPYTTQPTHQPQLPLLCGGSVLPPRPQPPHPTPTPGPSRPTSTRSASVHSSPPLKYCFLDCASRGPSTPSSQHGPSPAPPFAPHRAHEALQQQLLDVLRDAFGLLDYLVAGVGAEGGKGQELIGAGAETAGERDAGSKLCEWDQQVGVGARRCARARTCAVNQGAGQCACGRGASGSARPIPVRQHAQNLVLTRQHLPTTRACPSVPCPPEHLCCLVVLPSPAPSPPTTYGTPSAGWASLAPLSFPTLRAPTAPRLSRPAAIPPAPLHPTPTAGWAC